jgi:hypothetical protein
MTRLLSAIATAAGVAALIHDCIARCYADIDEALTDYLVEDRCPDYVPDSMVSDQ